MRRILLAVLTGLTVFGLTVGLTASLTVSSTDDVGAGTVTSAACDSDGVAVTLVPDATDVNYLKEVRVTGIDGVNCLNQYVYVSMNSDATQLEVQFTAGTSATLGSAQLLNGSLPLLSGITDVKVIISETQAA